MAKSQVVGRLINLANLPLRIILPESRENITQVAFKTIPSATKIEIKRILESLYGLKVTKVDTLNMEGKKKRMAGGFYRRPDYKKAYVTLAEPVTLSKHLFPFTVLKSRKDSKRANGKTEDAEGVDDDPEDSERGNK